MIRWLRYKLARLWYWRHVCVALEHNVFTGNAVFWCGRCGGTIRCAERGDHNVVTVPGWCPVGIAVFRYQAPLRATTGAPSAKEK